VLRIIQIMYCVISFEFVNWSFNYINLSFVENPSLSLFFSSLLCIRLGYLRTDLSGIDQASSLHLAYISLSFTPIFMLFDM